MRIVGEIKLAGIPALSKRAHGRVMRAGWAAIGAYWHKEYLPKHFEAGAFQRYGYQPRSNKWRRRKVGLARAGKVIKGGQVDLVATGTMEKLLESVGLVRAYPTRASIKMIGPRYVTLRPKGTQPNKYAEATRVLPGEVRILGGVFERALVAAIKREGAGG